MVKRISMKVLLILSIFSLTTIYSVNSYVLCDDGDSACPDYYICCLKNTGGYSCCSNTRVCCYGGTSCCIKQKSFNFLLESEETDSPVISVGAFSLKNTKRDFIDFRKQLKNSDINKLNASINDKFDNSDAIKISEIKKSKAENKQILDLKLIKNIYEFANSFFTAAKFYENFDNISNCKVDFEKIAENGQELISLISKFDFKKLEPQKISELLQDFSNLFHYASAAVLKCQNVKSDILDLEKRVKEYLANEDLKFKFMGSLIMNEPLIKQKVEEINEQCSNGDYVKCGTSSGELFSLVFYVL